MSTVHIKFKYSKITNHLQFSIGGQNAKKYDEEGYDKGDVADGKDVAYETDTSDGYLNIIFLAECDNNGSFEILNLEVDDVEIELGNNDKYADEIEGLIDYNHNIIISVA